MTQETRDQLARDLERDEGRERFLYPCTAGKLTVGVGHNIEDRGLPGPVIDLLLDLDIDIAVKDCERFDWWERLSPNRQRAMVNMAFNLGQGKLIGFRRMLAALDRDDYRTAAKEMRDSQWAKQTGARAERLAVLMERG